MRRTLREKGNPGRATGRLGRRTLGKTLVVAFAAMVAGCLSPTLPLPPPSAPLVSVPDETGEITITGRVSSRARVLVQNSRSSEIVGEMTGESGQYELQMQAEIGDLLFVWETSEGRDSPSTTVEVPSRNAPKITDIVEGAAGARSD